jgi:hypothetical protein
MIDLHAHTNESDGSMSPAELVQEAVRQGLEALAITDHDSLGGYDQARSHAQEAGLDLVCAVEVSASFHNRSVHLLAYFPNKSPNQQFQRWLKQLQDARHRRNQKLVAKLQQSGLAITLEEVSRRCGKHACRPHFATLLVERGYAVSIQHAFDEYLADDSSCFVEREEPAVADAIQHVLKSGGLSVLAHPYRNSPPDEVLELQVGEMIEFGLRGIEVYHSNHSPRQTCFYESLARRHRLVMTGGSDFHGETKPDIHLGTGRDGNLNVARHLLDELRSCS